MKEQLIERLKELQKQKQAAQTILTQAATDIALLNGAIQEIQYWIAKIEGSINEDNNIKG